MIAYGIYTNNCIFTWGGGWGIVQKKKEAAELNVLLCQKNSWKDLNRSIRVLNAYMHGIRYQSNLVKVKNDHGSKFSNFKQMLKLENLPR